MRLAPFLMAVLLTPALGAMRPTHAEHTPRYNQVSLNAQAQRNVMHDLMQVTLYTEAQARNPAELAAQITRALNVATTAARAVPDITVQTGSRTSTPVYGKESRRVIAWRERAELHLEARDMAALSALVVGLLDDMKIASQQFIISKASRKTHEDALIQEAIAAFRARAHIATEALGGTTYRLVSLNLDSGGFRPMVLRARMMSAMESSAKLSEPAQIEAGTSEVSVMASGVIEVHP